MGWTTVDENDGVDRGSHPDVEWLREDNHHLGGFVSVARLKETSNIIFGVGLRSNFTHSRHLGGLSDEDALREFERFRAVLTTFFDAMPEFDPIADEPAADALAKRLDRMLDELSTRHPKNDDIQLSGYHAVVLVDYLNRQLEATRGEEKHDPERVVLWDVYWQLRGFWLNSSGIDRNERLRVAREVIDREETLRLARVAEARKGTGGHAEPGSVLSRGDS